MSILDEWQQNVSKVIIAEDLLLERIFNHIKQNLTSNEDDMDDNGAFVGIILDGPEGIGKHYITKSLAETSKIPFTILDGKEDLLPLLIDDFDSLGAQRLLAKLTKHMKPYAPLSLIVIHNFDTLLCEYEEGDDRKDTPSVTSTRQISPFMKSTVQRMDALIRAFFDRAALGRLPSKQLILIGTCVDALQTIPKDILSGYPSFIHAPVRIGTAKQRQALLEHFALKNLSKSNSVCSWEEIALRTAGFLPKDLLALVKENVSVEELRHKVLQTNKRLFTSEYFAKCPLSDKYTLDRWVGSEPIVDECLTLLSVPIKPELVRERIRAPKGILICGPSGSGKTHLAFALARASSLNYAVVEGGRLRSRYPGVAERAVAQIFAEARQAAPSILIIDGIDRILPSRETATAMNDAPSLRLCTSFLTAIEGIEFQDMNISNSREELVDDYQLVMPVTVIATATSKASLDAALTRAGRLEYHYELPASLDAECRRKYFAKRIPPGALRNTTSNRDITTGNLAEAMASLSIQMEKQINNDDLIDRMVEETEGMNGADLDLLWQEAAMSAIRRLSQTAKLDDEHDKSNICSEEVVQVEWKDIEHAMWIVKEQRVHPEVLINHL